MLKINKDQKLYNLKIIYAFKTMMNFKKNIIVFRTYLKS